MKRWKRKIEDVAEAVRAANGVCVVLIGAGCSRSAGIPLAGELIREVEKNIPSAYRRASDPRNYNKVMAELNTMQRRYLLDRHIEAARINWAHLALAQLFVREKIDRILTVNFDPLVVRACALVGLFPAIYDLATAESFRKAHIAPRSVFYLNGQHTGFVTLNTEDELERHRKRLKSIVEDTGTRRTWIVVGYSGAADPLLDTLAENELFEGGLYWIGHAAEPDPAVRDKLLEAGKDAFYVGGQDADAFFTELARRLESFPPALIVRPFSHISTIVGLIDFSTGGDSGKQLEAALNTQIQRAEALVAELESRSNAQSWLVAGEFQQVLDWYERIPSPEDADKEIAAWALIESGNASDEQANSLFATDLAEARLLWSEAGRRYAQALAIKGDMHEAANNWGYTLDSEASALAATDLTEARRLWSEAGQRYAQVLAIKGDKHEAAYNWGNALDAEASAVAATDLTEARRLWSEAGKRYAQALAVKEDKHEAACNWGAALNAEASAVAATDLTEARRLWSEAGQRYAQALAIKEDKHEAAYNWGNALHIEASVLAATDLTEARRLWSEAGQRYAQVLAIKGDKHEAANNWGYVLNAEASALAATDLTEARRLWSEAGRRYAQALAIKGDMHDAAYNWGIALNAEASAVAATDLMEARRLWSEAGRRYAQALAIKGDKHEAAYNWGAALNAEASAVAATDLTEARRLWSEAGQRYAQALAVKEDKHEAANNWGNAYLCQYQALRAVDADEAVRCLDEGERILLQAEGMKEGSAAYNLACVAALRGNVDAALAWLRLSREKGELPSASHIRADRDFDGIRAAPAFVAGWQALFGPDEPWV
ncbi:MAG: hypothetical protein KAX47_05210 [Zoogloea sp.]|nr:hypothetical protein [Zoogloea sp.]